MLRLLGLTIAVASLGLPTVTAMAEPVAMVGDGLRSAVAGKTVYLDTPVGALPISYRADGTMSGQSNALAVYTGTTADKGTWWVQNNRLCQRWQTWLDKATYCYSMQRDGQTVTWSRNDGRTGTARIAHH